MIKQIFSFYFSLIIILTPFCLLHQKLYNASFLIDSYFYNALIAGFVITLVILFQKRHSEYIAFYFFLGTTIKFLVFFLAIHPEYKRGERLDNVLLMAFFVPYFLTLIVETTALIFLVNTSKETNKIFKK